MLLIDFQDLTEDEYAMLFGIVNVLYSNENIEYDEESIKWIRKDVFVQKFMSAEKKILKEFKPVYDSLKKKIKIVT